MLNRRAMLSTFGTFLISTRFAAAGNLNAAAPTRAQKLIAAAESQIGVTLTYDPTYTAISYPSGDVPIVRGVCTDVIIRAYRQGLGIDLQKLVHEDMSYNFSSYPTRWGLKKTDSNIDHRRVPNLQTFFKRQGAELPVSKMASNYKAGDVISMMLPGNLPHIALVTPYRSADGSKPLCIHNIGRGAQREDVLFLFPVTGHYRFKV